MTNYYEVLEIPFHATPDEVKQSFRRLSKLYHPDLNKTPEKDYLLILEAYKTLIDAKRRDAYNETYLDTVVRKEIEEENRSAQAARLPFDRVVYSRSMSNLLNREEDPMDAFLPPNKRGRIDEDVILYIKPLELLFGMTAVIEIPGKERCPVCRGGKIGCYRCDGDGWVKTMEKIRYRIPSRVVDTEIIDLDLSAYKREGVVFRMSRIKIRIALLR